MFKHLTKIISATLITGAFLLTPSKAADLQDILSAGKVRIGVPVDVAPFGSNDANNNPVGLDVDMARNIAEALGVELELQQITGANRIPYLLTEKLDIVISVMGATPQRALQIAFSSPYSGISGGVFGPKSIAVTSADELTDETIAVARGTTQDLLLTKLAPDANIQRYDDDATAAAAFTSGQAELFATADIVAKVMMNQDPSLELYPKFIMMFNPTHIGVRHDSPELLQWLNTYVFLGMLDGSLAALTEKWLGTEMPDLPAL